ncbi:L-2-amino-thiazoline-4-carboxylic acid hydrolase [Pseudoflavonifractor sp. HCP28S3_F10]|uniref:L-2-amino-thiazoline-4-carboxylic acid hydrolase n=1 Tax=Pseudoflavonifractor sp. HCP28S3_F10 TaxID=3438947 RepID=UPI003F8A9D34
MSHICEESPAYTAEDHALLFGVIAKTVCDTLGESAAPLLKEAVIRYGTQRGKRMRLRAEKDGLPICMATYLLYREYQLRPGQFCSTKGWNDQGDMQDCAFKCPWAETWERYGLSRYTSVYCRNIDPALGRGFDESVVIDSKANLTDGAPHCDIWFRGAAQTEGVSAEGLDLDRRARLPWDYHLAHVYRVFSDTLQELVGGELADQILERSCTCFAQHTQHKNPCAFLSLTDMNFESIGDY